MNFEIGYDFQHVPKAFDSSERQLIDLDVSNFEYQIFAAQAKKMSVEKKETLSDKFSFSMYTRVDKTGSLGP